MAAATHGGVAPVLSSLRLARLPILLISTVVIDTEAGDDDGADGFERGAPKRGGPAFTRASMDRSTRADPEWPRAAACSLN
jgi:hypothetical protein